MGGGGGGEVGGKYSLHPVNLLLHNSTYRIDLDVTIKLTLFENASRGIFHPQWQDISECMTVCSNYLLHLIQCQVWRQPTVSHVLRPG